MRELAVVVILGVAFIWLIRKAIENDREWDRAHEERCAQWIAEATSPDMKVQVRMTCAKIAQDRANAAQIAAAAVAAGAMVSSSTSRR